MRVAVVIPCYNGARHLKAAIESVQSQERPPEEILVIDDGSTDNTAQVAQDAGARVITSAENRGSACARNLGIANTSAELVAFLDGDDAWTPLHLKTLLPAFENQRVGLAFGQTARMGTVLSLRTPALLSPKNFFLDLLEDNWIGQSAVVARRDALLRSGSYRTGARYAEDYDLWLRMSLEYEFVTTTAPTCLRRLHPKQLSRNNAAFVMAAFTARQGALSLASRLGVSVPPDHVQASLIRAARLELENARYSGDWSTVEEVCKAIELFPALEPEVLAWRDRHRPRWLMYRLVAILRRRLKRSA